MPALLPLLLCLGACFHVGGTTEAQAQAERQSCSFKAGAMPATTLASTDPTGTQIPIDHIVLVMQENRSFDAYFSHLQVPGQTVDTASDTATNPDGKGGTVSRFHWSASTAANGNPNGLDYYCFADTDHGWGQTHAEYDNGALDGFVTTNDDSGNGARAMGYYDDTDIPFYYGLAQSFAISDRHFCSVLGPTYPNRLFYWGGTSYGLTYNALAPATGDATPQYPNLFTELTAANVSWKVYSLSLPSTALVWISGISSPAANFPGLQQFYADAQSGNLPAVSVVEGNDSGEGEITVNGTSIDAVDEHPPQDPQLGQNFVASVVEALMHSPNWPTSAMFITYDEHGGEYDHVPPPPACKPDDMPLQLGPDAGYTEWNSAGFDQYGFRTPLFAISPYAKRGYVSHEVVDHTSITRFVETRFNLPALTARDANAWPLLDMFDFSQPDTSIPNLPGAAIDPSQQATCASPDAGYPPSSSGF